MLSSAVKSDRNLLVDPAILSDRTGMNNGCECMLKKQSGANIRRIDIERGTTRPQQPHKNARSGNAISNERSEFFHPSQTHEPTEPLALGANDLRPTLDVAFQIRIIGDSTCEITRQRQESADCTRKMT
jgi:hypothetical protein